MGIKVNLVALNPEKNCFISHKFKQYFSSLRKSAKIELTKALKFSTLLSNGQAGYTMKNKNIVIGLFAIILGFSMNLSADSKSGYYRWKDKDGNLKLSDRPPEAGIKAEFIETPGSRRSRSTSDEPAEQQAATGQAQPATPGEPVKMEVVPEKDPERCKQAQENMKAFEGFSRIRVTDADGTQRLLTEEEKQVQIERSKKAIKDNCN